MDQYTFYKIILDKISRTFVWAENSGSPPLQLDRKKSLDDKNLTAFTNNCLQLFVKLTPG
jgi:hypothetical protein